MMSFTNTCNRSSTTGRCRPALGILLTCVLTVTGCSQYGEVSPKAYEISTALYSLCNRRDDSRLDTVNQLIADSAAAGELSSSEQRWLTDILESARSGSWDIAARNARTMMQEQVHSVN